VINCVCPHCGAGFAATVSSVNRANRRGAPKFCGKACAGLSRRSQKTDAEKREAKAGYDAKRRADFADRIKAEKAEYYRRTKDPVKEAAVRKMRMPKHVEYCRRPEYRARKQEYDQEHRAKKLHGDLWEAAILTLKIRRACLELFDDTEIRRQKCTLNKKSNRRRSYDRTNSNQLEIGSLGHA
jgi:hypothetical protein